jgi:hypothetical protein
MEVLDGPNSDCVSFTVEIFLRIAKQLNLLRYSQHFSWDDSITDGFADYRLDCAKACFLASARRGE